MYGVLLVCVGFTLYLLGVAMAIPRHLLGGGPKLLALNELLVWYSGVPVMLGLGMALLDLFVLLSRKRSPRLEVRHHPISNTALTVVLTAYNDEDGIADAVLDFRSHPRVSEVIVVSNNSSDRTMQRAELAGATVVNEPQQGYGRCVFRCLQEALTRDSELIVLCEGDRTFRAYDIDKFLAYAPHARAVQRSRLGCG